jgi:3-phenylpropionate/cinnamic acid dioxygenase small subunit
MPDLERRIRRLEDRAELQDLLVKYFLAADDDDYPALAETFARDATFTAGGFDGGSSRTEIVEFIRADRRTMGPTIHTLNYSLFSFQDDDHSKGVVGAHLELSRGGSTLFGAVRYADAYVREEGRWRIRHRNMLMIHVGPWEQVGSSLTCELRVRWPGAAPQKADLPAQ